ncbi:hypothetical protein BC835DRAFT_997632 [Cytidiella melzeri]|nr:hypothetical protein BC835DRAFT_997632 [Cytidiella melzeri]
MALKTVVRQLNTAAMYARKWDLDPVIKVCSLRSQKWVMVAVVVSCVRVSLTYIRDISCADVASRDSGSAKAYSRCFLHRHIELRVLCFLTRASPKTIPMRRRLAHKCPRLGSRVRLKSTNRPGPPMQRSTFLHRLHCEQRVICCNANVPIMATITLFVTRELVKAKDPCPAF